MVALQLTSKAQRRNLDDDQSQCALEKEKRVVCVKRKGQWRSVTVKKASNILMFFCINYMRPQLKWFIKRHTKITCKITNTIYITFGNNRITQLDKSIMTTA